MDRIADECQMLVHRDHCRRLSTHTTSVCTSGDCPKCAASPRSVAAQNSSSCRCPPSVSPSSNTGSDARMSTCAWATVSPSLSSALNVIQPANMWPCGVISVNDSSSA